MQRRILLFEDEEAVRKLYGIYLRSKGYEVLEFATPVTCALIAENRCTCPRDYACADMIITDMNMPQMSGLELIRYQLAKGCHAPPQNKAILSAGLTPEQEEEARALGCRYLRKSAGLKELWAWLGLCEQHIPADRHLVATEALWSTARVAGSA